MRGIRKCRSLLGPKPTVFRRFTNERSKFDNSQRFYCAWVVVPGGLLYYLAGVVACRHCHGGGATLIRYLLVACLSSGTSPEQAAKQAAVFCPTARAPPAGDDIQIYEGTVATHTTCPLPSDMHPMSSCWSYKYTHLHTYTYACLFRLFDRN